MRHATSSRMAYGASFDGQFRRAATGDRVGRLHCTSLLLALSGRRKWTEIVRSRDKSRHRYSITVDGRIPGLIFRASATSRASGHPRRCAGRCSPSEALHQLRLEASSSSRTAREDARE